MENSSYGLVWKWLSTVAHVFFFILYDRFLLGNDNDTVLTNFTISWSTFIEVVDGLVSSGGLFGEVSWLASIIVVDWFVYWCLYFNDRLMNVLKNESRRPIARNFGINVHFSCRLTKLISNYRERLCDTISGVALLCIHQSKRGASTNLYMCIRRMSLIWIQWYSQQANASK